MTPRLPVVLTHRAERQIQEAAEWWHHHRPAAPGAVHAELARAFDLVAANPGIGANAENVRLRAPPILQMGGLEPRLVCQSARISTAEEVVR